MTHIPKPPPQLKDEPRALACWDREAERLARNGALTDVDVGMFAVWCRLAAEFEDDPKAMPAEKRRKLGELSGEFFSAVANREVKPWIVDVEFHDFDAICFIAGPCGVTGNDGGIYIDIANVWNATIPLEHLAADFVRDSDDSSLEFLEKLFDRALRAARAVRARSYQPQP